MIEPGSIVIVHLINPSEKLWGVMQDLAVHGVTLRALGVESFEDWMAQAVRRTDQTLGLATVFVPLFRVEKIYLDEAVGEVQSYQQRFLRRVGVSVQEYVGLEESLDELSEADGGVLPS